MEEQLLFYSQQHEKLQGLIEKEEKLLKSFQSIIPPAIILIQSAILQWNLQYNELESNLLSSFDVLQEKNSKKFENIFITFGKMLQLEKDILETQDPNEKGENMIQFLDYLAQVEKNHPEVIADLSDVLLMEFNEFINAGLEEYSKSYHNFMKIMDGFQVKIAQYQSFFTAMPKKLDNFLTFPGMIQEWEEIFDHFTKEIHLGAEILYDKKVELFSQILTDFYKYLKLEQNDRKSMEEFLEIQFAKLLKINSLLTEKLSTHFSKIIGQYAKEMDAAMKEMTSYINSHIVYIKGLNLEPDLTLHTDLEKVHKKLTELAAKKKKGVRD